MFSLKEALRSSTPQVLWITRSTPIVKILETPWYPSVCLSVTSGSQRGSCCRIDRGRLLRDREYLLHAVCAEFQKAPSIPPLPSPPPPPGLLLRCLLCAFRWIHTTVDSSPRRTSPRPAIAIRPSSVISVCPVASGSCVPTLEARGSREPANEPKHQLYFSSTSYHWKVAAGSECGEMQKAKTNRFGRIRRPTKPSRAQQPQL